MIDTVKYQKKSCKWSQRDQLRGNSEELKDPHDHIERQNLKNIYNDVVDMIGNTPLVKLSKIPLKDGVKCEIIAKLEFFNPGGSLKDRVGKRTVHDLEKRGMIQPGFTLIEATSGNCGIGLAMLSAIKGYKAIITMPDKMSLEKKYILNSMGAECIRTPSDASFNSPESLLGVAFRFNKEIKTSRFLDQYSDDSNSLANYDETAEELWQDLDGKVDYVVLTVGTGGTLTGIARKFKERNPNVKIVGVDPYGSKLALPNSLNERNCNFKVEGIGYDFIPKNLDQESVDLWYKVEDKDTFKMSRRIIKEEGILAGGSSGTVLCAAIELAKTLPDEKRICVIFCDGIRNYISKYISDDWMIENNFYNEEEVENSLSKFNLNKIYGSDKLIGDVIDQLKIESSLCVDTEKSINEVLDLMNLYNLDYLPVFNNGKLFSVTYMDLIMQKILSGYVKVTDSIKRATTNEFKQLDVDEPVNRLSRAFKNKNYVLVKSSNDEEDVYYSLFAKDLIKFMKMDTKN